MRFSLTTWNINSVRLRIDIVAKFLKAMRPDVLCLQEMPRHPFSDHRIAEFAESVGLVWSGGNRHRMSTAIVTVSTLCHLLIAEVLTARAGRAARRSLATCRYLLGRT